MKVKYLKITAEIEFLLDNSIPLLRPENEPNTVWQLHKSQPRGHVTDTLYYAENALEDVIRELKAADQQARAQESYCFKPVLHALKAADISVGMIGVECPNDLILTIDFSEA